MSKSGKKSNIFKIVGVAVIAIVVTCMTGCGHNFGVNSKGMGLRAAWNPDSLMPEISVGYYEVGSIAIRENAEGIYESDSVGTLAGDATEGTTEGTLGTKLEITTGQQANGYTTKNEIFSPNTTSEPEEEQNEVVTE